MYMTVGALEDVAGPDVVPPDVVPPEVVELEVVEPEVVTTPEELPLPAVGCGGFAGSAARGTAAMLSAAPSATI